MRKIAASQVAVFSALVLAALALAVAATRLTVDRAPLGDFRGVVLLLAGLLFLYVFAILIYRLFLTLFPLSAGEIAPGSRQEFVYHVYLLFYLILFYPVMRSGAVPVPLMRLFYLALGARLGANTYSSGIIKDPGFVEIGSNSIVGQGALLIPHVVEGPRLAHYPIRVGDNVTIGAHAVVLCDVVIGNGAIVAVGAVVARGTRIAHGEVWGGVPARCIRRAGDATPDA